MKSVLKLTTLLLFFIFAYSSSYAKTNDSKSTSAIISFTNCRISSSEMQSTFNIVNERCKVVFDKNYSLLLDTLQREIVFSTKKTIEPEVIETIIAQGNIQIVETYTSSEMLPIIQAIDSISIGTNTFTKERNNWYGELEIISELYSMIYVEPSSSPNSPEILRIKPNDTTRIIEILTDTLFTMLLPKDILFYWSISPNYEDFFNLYAIKKPLSYTPITNSMIETCSTGSVKNKEYDYEYNYLQFKLEKEYWELWSSMTQKNIQKPLAIIINNRVYSAPFVQDQITEGDVQITGDEDLLLLKVLSASILGEPILTNLVIKEIQ